MPNNVVSTCARRDVERMMMAIRLLIREGGWGVVMRGCEGDRLTRREVEIRTGVEDESNSKPKETKAQRSQGTEVRRRLNHVIKAATFLQLTFIRLQCPSTLNLVSFTLRLSSFRV